MGGTHTLLRTTPYSRSRRHWTLKWIQIYDTEPTIHVEWTRSTTLWEQRPDNFLSFSTLMVRSPPTRWKGDRILYSCFVELSHMYHSFVAVWSIFNFRDLNIVTSVGPRSSPLSFRGGFGNEKTIILRGPRELLAIWSSCFMEAFLQPLQFWIQTSQKIEIIVESAQCCIL
jgi:hypothetical protein